MKGTMRFVFVLLTFGLFCCLLGAAAELPQQTSMIQLLANPDKYDGKLVVVYGYLALGERPALYFHKEDLERGIMPDAIWVDSTGPTRTNWQALNLQYVRIVGTFKVGGKEHIYFQVGGLSKISECVVWPFRPPNSP
jgi:hypothetical protein